MTLFTYTQKQKQLLMKMTLMLMYLSQFILQLYETQINLGKSSAWIIDLVIHHNIYNLKYNPLAGSIYIKLAKKNQTV